MFPGEIGPEVSVPEIDSIPLKLILDLLAKVIL